MSDSTARSHHRTVPLHERVCKQGHVGQYRVAEGQTRARCEQCLSYRPEDLATRVCKKGHVGQYMIETGQARCQKCRDQHIANWAVARRVARGAVDAPETPPSAARTCKRGHAGQYAVTPGWGRTECQQCVRERTPAQQKELDRGRAYSAANREKRRAYSAAWRKANPEKVNAWARANPERQKANSRDWLERNRVKANHKSRARKMKYATGDLTQKQWLEIVALSDGYCMKCGAEGVTMDHVVPLSQGGAHSQANIQALCSRCNKSKFTKNVDYRPRWVAS